jgi:hypothetical protein
MAKGNIQERHYESQQDGTESDEDFYNRQW